MDSIHQQYHSTHVIDLFFTGSTLSSEYPKWRSMFAPTSRVCVCVCVHGPLVCIIANCNARATDLLTSQVQNQQATSALHSRADSQDGKSGPFLARFTCK